MEKKKFSLKKLTKILHHPVIVFLCSSYCFPSI